MCVYVHVCIYVCVSVYIYIYIYIYIYFEMIDCGESDNIIEICGKLDKSNALKLVQRHDKS